jgi:hypothetical protein
MWWQARAGAARAVQTAAGSQGSARCVARATVVSSCQTLVGPKHRLLRDATRRADCGRSSLRLCALAAAALLLCSALLL